MTIAPTMLTLTMSGIAELAHVSRAVVSTWRRRFSSGGTPFPDPIGSEHGVERFDAVGVAQWLVSTRHGNNPSAVEDVAAYATLGSLAPQEDRTTFEALTGLLCLKTMTGRLLQPLDRDDLLDLADEHDPDDRLLYSELDARQDHLEILAGYSDRLADAAYSIEEAFERLLVVRARSDLRARSAVVTDPSALSLVAQIAVALAPQGAEVTTYADLTPGSSDLLLAVLRQHGDRGPLDIVTAKGNDPSSRLGRRRLRVHDVHREGVRANVDDLDPARLVMYVTQLPPPASPVESDAQILERAENLALQLAGAQRAVVLAPAAALTDRLVDPVAQHTRDDLLRAGHVYAMVRLPKGLLKGRSRQALALWLLGPAQHDRSEDERAIYVADLVDETLTTESARSLTTDLVAATGHRSLARAHAFRYVRPVLTRLLTAAGGDLVEVGAEPQQTRRWLDPAATMIGLERAAEQVSGPIAAAPALRVGPASSRDSSTPTLVRSMLAHRTLQAVPGSRIDAADIQTGIGISVIGVAELTGVAAIGSRTIDPLVLAGSYDAARLTHPGDVVFCASPRPAALVDRDGASVVLYPARVLRIDAADPGGLLSEVVATDIRRQPERSRDWRSWPLRRVPTVPQRAALAGAIEDLRVAREAALQRAEDLGRLTDLLTDAVTAGAAELPPDLVPTRGR